ncbi:hypothetical protein TSAR_013911 [Trichomalopsis sarcophagae]|uniref:Uncharacterized protein n=1 Tax=Trichomalopsis sarcophagae TaxID=543379 RepID=A0A232FLS5_9HYME|nr:hypothetical protein TSAR_013911 [Trichomalopsis sarcophagae]
MQFKLTGWYLTQQYDYQYTQKERNKPTPPPKPVALATGQFVYRDLSLTPEMYNQLRGMQKKAKDLRQEIKNLRRMSQAQAHTVRETIRDAFVSIRTILLSSREQDWSSSDAEKLRLSRDEDLYKQEMLWLEKDLTGLESTVEELRGNVINRKTRVNMSDVENMALILSKASCTDIKSDICDWYYHPKCMPILAIREGGKTIQVCKNCLVTANETPRCTSTSSPFSRSSSPLPQQQKRSVNRLLHNHHALLVGYNKILDKLNKLDNIEKQQNEMKNQLSESKSSLEKRMTAIEKSLEPLREIP